MPRWTSRHNDGHRRVPRQLPHRRTRIACTCQHITIIISPNATAWAHSFPTPTPAGTPKTRHTTSNGPSATPAPPTPKRTSSQTTNSRPTATHQKHKHGRQPTFILTRAPRGISDTSMMLPGSVDRAAAGIGKRRGMPCTPSMRLHGRSNTAILPAMQSMP
eukprot:118565-Chlamydomonas_euryale.AAC.5